MHIQSLFLLIIVILSNLKLSGQTTIVMPGDTLHKKIVAAPSKNKITIDGLLSEPDWQLISGKTNFTGIEPKPGVAAFFKTVVKTIYNQQYLFVGIFCYDTVGKKNYKAPDLKRDFAFWKHDLIGFAIDGFNDKRNSITFFVNAFGAQRDYQCFDDTYFDVDWNGLWNVKTTRTDSCWIAEFAIPWKTLRYKYSLQDSTSFGINFQRVQRTANEKSAWAAYPRSVGINRMEYAGSITGIKPPKPSTNVQFNLYALSNHSYAKGNEAGNYKKLNAKLGGDIKWAITPNLVTDVTFNTDFAQADADRLVNNLTRFSIFFPEKRQFFLENASLFGVNYSPYDFGNKPNLLLQPFFSRKIGLNENNLPIPIDAGARLVYRSAKRSAGVLGVRQRSEGVSPLQHFFVGRYTENIGKAGRIGVIVSGKTVAADSTKNGYTNITTAADGFFRLNDKQTISFMMAHAGNISTTKSGFSGFLQYEYNANTMRASWTQAYIDNRYDSKTGFVSRNNVIATIPGFQLNIRKKWLPLKKIIRDYTPGITAEWYHQSTTGKLTERLIQINPFTFNTIKGASLSYAVKNSFQYLLTDFNPLGIIIKPGTYNYNRQLINIETNPSQKLSGSFGYEWGKYFNDRLSTVDASIVYAPAPFVSINAGIINNRLQKNAVDSSSTNVQLFSLEGRFAVNPQLQLTCFYQFNSLNKQNVYNIRFSWEYKPLSYFFVVFNNRAYTTATGKQLEQNTIVKISYLKQL